MKIFWGKRFVSEIGTESCCVVLRILNIDAGRAVMPGPKLYCIYTFTLKAYAILTTKCALVKSLYRVMEYSILNIV
jgi:hypothetical protein